MTDTNYYLHHQDFAESVHIGKISALSGGGRRWITDTQCDKWNGTSVLMAYLEEADQDDSPGWVSDEYGNVLTFSAMAGKIYQCDATAEVLGPFD